MYGDMNLYYGDIFIERFKKLPLQKNQRVQRIIGYDVNNRKYELTMNWLKDNYIVKCTDFYQKVINDYEDNKIYSLPYGAAWDEDRKAVFQQMGLLSDIHKERNMHVPLIH